METPTEGEILVDGEEVSALKGQSLKDYRAKVQAVFQDPWSSLSPRMRVEDIVSEPLVVSRSTPRDEAKARVADLLQDVGLHPGQAELYPHQFSGGQRQRIAVASALSPDPKLIILDEPVSALDVSIRAQIMNLLKDLQDQYHLSYLLVTHNLSTMRYMAHETAVMYLGRIVEHASTRELIDSPLHPYTKSLFSAALPAHPDDQTETVVLQGEAPSPINRPQGAASTRAVRRRCPCAPRAIPSRRKLHLGTPSRAISTRTARGFATGRNLGGGGPNLMVRRTTFQLSIAL